MLRARDVRAELETKAVVPGQDHCAAAMVARLPKQEEVQKLHEESCLSTELCKENARSKTVEET